VLAVATPLFKVQDPPLFGIPFFYWFQMALVPFSVVCIYVADRLGRA
jgi:Protein of unknown function (DUF3311)